MQGDGDHRSGFPQPLKVLHYIIAGLMALQLGCMLLFKQMQSLEYGQLILSMHMNLGFLVWVAAGRYIVLRLRYKVPAPLQTLPDWQRRAALAVHGLLALALLLQTPIGFYLTWARGESVPLLWLLQIPPFFEVSPEALDPAHALHAAVASLMLGLLGVHLGAIVFNYARRGVDVLPRMNPLLGSADRFTHRAPFWVQISGACLALILIAFGVGGYALAKNREAAMVAKQAYDGAFQALSHAHSAQNSLLKLINESESLRGDGRLSEASAAAAQISEGIAADLLEVADRTNDLEARALATSFAGGGPQEIEAAQRVVEDIVMQLNGKAFELRIRIEQTASHSHDLLLIVLIPTAALGLLIAAFVSLNVRRLVGRLRQVSRDIAQGKAPQAMTITGDGEMAALMRDLLSAHQTVSTQRQTNAAFLNTTEALLVDVMAMTHRSANGLVGEERAACLLLLARAEAMLATLRMTYSDVDGHAQAEVGPVQDALAA